MGKKFVPYKFLVIREASGIVSQITQFHGVPEDWNGIDIADWAAKLFSDLVDAGWMILFKPADEEAVSTDSDFF